MELWIWELVFLGSSNLLALMAEIMGISVMLNPPSAAVNYSPYPRSPCSCWAVSCHVSSFAICKISLILHSSGDFLDIVNIKFVLTELLTNISLHSCCIRSHNIASLGAWRSCSLIWYSWFSCISLYFRGFF